MASIGELATFYPVSGSFGAYATRFIDPGVGVWSWFGCSGYCGF